MRVFVASLVLLVAGTVTAQEASNQATEVSSAIDRGVGFLAKDALKWKADHNCVSCHHAALVVWALNESKLRGHTVDEAVLTEMTKWMAESGAGVVGVPRPKDIPRAFNTKAVYFALGLSSVPKPDESTQKGLKLMLGTIEKDQLENGSWAAWPETRPPLFGRSDDSMSSLAILALMPSAAAGDEAAVAARDKAVQWLTTTKTDDDPQSIALRLMILAKLGRPSADLQPYVQRITERQNSDGGWSQTKDMPSDAWATGQALYALSHAGSKPDDPVIARGQAFLVKTQQPDGSWSMTSRPVDNKPDGKGGGPIPITGGGSAWGVIGLAKSRQ